MISESSIEARLTRFQRKLVDWDIGIPVVRVRGVDSDYEYPVQKVQP